MLATIQYLGEIAQRCLRGQALDEETARWLGRFLDDFLAKGSRAFEEALGLVQGRGGVPWWLEFAIRRRDAALRELARSFFGEKHLTAQAKSIHTLAIRYAASAWQSDKDLHEVPTTYIGTPQHWLWHAFHSGARMPIGERQLRSILL